jgi:hypothetical protein
LASPGLGISHGLVWFGCAWFCLVLPGFAWFVRLVSQHITCWFKFEPV